MFEHHTQMTLTYTILKTVICVYVYTYMSIRPKLNVKLNPSWKL